jgi:hypothetical protein
MKKKNLNRFDVKLVPFLLYIVIRVIFFSRGPGQVQ